MHDDRDDAANRLYRLKSCLMAQMLGTEHHTAMHAIVPWSVGGSLDLYYFTGRTPGTAIATKELAELGQGPSTEELDAYELVAFTRHPLDLDAAKTEHTPFGRAHRRIRLVLNRIAIYALQASIKPHDTCEFPEEMGELSGRCVVFDAAGDRPDGHGSRFGLLCVIEVFRSEMEFAMTEGAASLLARLKDRGHYPYSDLDREPVA